ncbi:hypothetical protein HanIR_Chr13g0668261 [Helianthus annuus]|nr:hypothetical protein HanIR_Chr13g0668261 [Helianthus annuus]
MGPAGSSIKYRKIFAGQIGFGNKKKRVERVSGFGRKKKRVELVRRMLVFFLISFSFSSL